MGDASAGDKVTFVVKNPSRHDSDAFQITVSLNSSLADIKNILYEQYDGKPSPSAQTLIYAGKVLKDPTLTVKDIVKQPVGSDVPHSLHLVVRSPAVMHGTANSSSSSSATSSYQSTMDVSGRIAPQQSTPAAAAAPATGNEANVPQEVAGNSISVSESTSQHQEGTAGSSTAEPGSGSSSLGSPAAPAEATPAGAMPAVSPAFEFGTSSGAAASSNSSIGPAPATSATATSLPMAGPDIPYPYMYLNAMNMNPMMNNQIMGAAYQAAYSAALQSMRQHMQQQGSTASASSSSAVPNQGSSAAAAAPMLPLTASIAPALLYYPAAYQQAAAMAAMVAAATAQQGQHGQAGAVHLPAPASYAIPAQFAVPFLGLPAHLAAHPAAAAAPQQVPQPAAAAAAAAPPAGRIGLRQRLPHGVGLYIGARPAAAFGANQQQADGGAAAAAAAVPGQQQVGAAHAHGAHAHGHRRYRTRTITFRISMRTLLQMLVFGMVLYQHCTWPRLCILLAGAVILYATALWAPFRQFLLSLAMPPRPEQLAEIQRRRQQQAQAAPVAAPEPVGQGQGGLADAAAAPAAAGNQQLGNQQQQQQQQQQHQPPGAAAAMPAAAAPGAAVPGAPNLPAWLQQGIIREILTVIVSFITSLLPAWNYNAEDAAVFAAAQEMMAREAREQAQQQQQAGAAAGAGDGDAGNAAVAAP